MAKGNSTTGRKMVGVDSTMIRPKVEPPPELTEIEREYWWRVVDNVPNDYFNPSDYAILSAYIVMYRTFSEAKAKVDEEGMVIMDPSGKQVINPWAKILSDATGKLSVLTTKVRLCPGARMKNDRTKEKIPVSVPNTPLGGLIAR